MNLTALRVLRRDRRGNSSPVVVETADGQYVVKLRGAAQGAGPLVAEVIVAAIAEAIELAVPPRRVVSLAVNQATDDHNDELADLLAASAGDNLGFTYLPTARALSASDLARVPADFAARVRWLDWLTLNPDRGPANPNILVEGSRYWLIDHGAALPFQYDWAAVTEDSPTRFARPVPHVFDSLVPDLDEWDPFLTGMVTHATLNGAVAQVPDSFLRPMMNGDPTREAMERRRAAYAAFLWKRLRGPRPFGTRARSR